MLVGVFDIMLADNENTMYSNKYKITVKLKRNQILDLKKCNAFDIMTLMYTFCFGQEHTYLYIL